MDERTQRLALNESLFRELNEGVEEQADSAVIEAYCECANLDCIERIAMTEDEYVAVRSDPTQFAVRPGHEALDIEEIVDGNDRFEIVRKRGESAAVATLLQPDRN